MSSVASKTIVDDAKNVRSFPLDRQARVLASTEFDTQSVFVKYFRVGLRYKWSILAFLIAGITIGGLKAASSIPIYRAVATIAIGPDISNLVPGQNLNMFYAISWRFYETQYEMLRSRAVAERVVDKLGLIHRKNVNEPKEKKDSLIDVIKKSVGWNQSTSEPLSNTAVALQILTPEQEKNKRDSLAGMILGGISVKGSEQSQITRVSFESPNPQFAGEVANAIVDAYIELGLESRLDRTKRTSTWLTERLEDLRKKVVASENSLQEFQEKEGMVNLESIERITENKLKALNEEVLKKQQEHAELSKRYGPKHPKMINASEELNNAKIALEEASKTVVTKRSKQFELGKLERELSSNRQLYEAFLEKFKESDLSSQYNISNAQVVDEAKSPASPYKPDRNKIMIQWGVIGLLFGILLALFREQLHNTFRATEDIEQRLALPVLGVIPLLGKSLKGKKLNRTDSAEGPERYFLVERRSPFSEAVNHVRTSIAYSNVDNPPKTILITSSVQGEGKTTLASNLALSCSYLGRTLLVDADLRKPRVEQITSSPSKGGLVEYVAGINSLQECIVQDIDCPNLYILRSGVVPPNPLELLSSQKLSNTLEELKSKFSYVIIDTAPVLPVSDSIVLGHMVDALIMVVQSERTTHHMAQDALRRLQGSQVNPLGVVLSQVQVRKSTYYYDGKYQYYYSGYYRSSEDSVKG